MTSTTELPTISQIDQACAALQHILLFTDYSSTIIQPSDLYEQLGYAPSVLQQYSQPGPHSPASMTTQLGFSAERASELLSMVPTDTMTRDDITRDRKNFLITILPKTISSLAQGLLGDCRPHLEALDQGDTYIKWKEVFTTAKRCWETNPLRFGSFAGDEERHVDRVVEGNLGERRLSDTDYAEVYGPARRALLTWIEKAKRG